MQGGDHDATNRAQPKRFRHIGIRRLPASPGPWPGKTAVSICGLFEKLGNQRRRNRKTDTV